MNAIIITNASTVEIAALVVELQRQHIQIPSQLLEKPFVVGNCGQSRERKDRICYYTGGDGDVLLYRNGGSG